MIDYTFTNMLLVLIMSYYLNKVLYYGPKKILMKNTTGKAQDIGNF
jgi:hypothetical protein